MPCIHNVHGINIYIYNNNTKVIAKKDEKGKKGEFSRKIEGNWNDAENRN